MMSLTRLQSSFRQQWRLAERKRRYQYKNSLSEPQLLLNCPSFPPAQAMKTCSLGTWGGKDFCFGRPIQKRLLKEVVRFWWRRGHDEGSVPRNIGTDNLLQSVWPPAFTKNNTAVEPRTCMAKLLFEVLEILNCLDNFGRGVLSP